MAGVAVAMGQCHAEGETGAGGGADDEEEVGYGGFAGGGLGGWGGEGEGGLGTSALGDEDEEPWGLTSVREDTGDEDVVLTFVGAGGRCGSR